MQSTNGLVLAAMACWPLAAHAADRPVHMQVPPPVGKDAAAMPVIADPADDAERRINAAVRRLDSALKGSMAECRTGGGRNWDWERSVDVTMRGPGFISYAITDSMYCGGAHPSSGTMAIVYDLRTGAPVDWTGLLPASLTGTVALGQQSDGSRMVTLSSGRLYSLFLAGYDASHAAPSDAECRNVVHGEQADAPPSMQVWLDAKRDGLAVLFDLPHAAQACADPVVIPWAVLQREGAAPALLDALAAAHGG